MGSNSPLSQAAIALGSNIGNSWQILTDALTVLDQTSGISVVARSPIYQTVAVGPPQPDYLNRCALVSTTLTPLDLLTTLLDTEVQFGRVRRERWGPRVLDLDLLLFDDRILVEPGLQIPHPRMTQRAFVLVPLADIAPDWIEPVSHRSIAEWVQMVDDSGVKRFNRQNV